MLNWNRKNKRFRKTKRFINWLNERHNFNFIRLGSYRFGDEELKIIIEFAGETTQDNFKEVIDKNKLMLNDKDYNYYVLRFKDFKDRQHRQKVVIQLFNDMAIKYKQEQKQKEQSKDNIQSMNDDMVKNKREIMDRDIPPCDIFDDITLRS